MSASSCARGIDIVEPDVTVQPECGERGFEGRQRFEPAVRHKVEESGVSQDHPSVFRTSWLAIVRF